ncbi:RomA family MBL fold metallo-hydrolase [Enterobacteriaceae bacterium 4M9]|nr:RomA family MBL fold metallo-hydrolase [Enterobacteriaceae bacterium 4M9]
MNNLKISVVIAMLIAAVGSLSYFLNPVFGRAPEEERLQAFTQSPQYRDGQFHNAQPTPMLTGEKGRIQLLWEFVTQKRDNLRPATALPLVPTDLRALNPDEDVVVWLGHSSWYLQLAGKRILIDPVFSHYAAPFSFINKAFAGPYPWRAEDMPAIDYLIISHDHYDHLDYATVRALLPKVRQALVPLGVGSHLEFWGMEAARIQESDWQQTWPLSEALTVHVLPARHFSGRGLKTNPTLWASFLFVTPERKIYYSGDSGYGPHFKAIGERFGPIDIAIMENGQYDPDWKNIHMHPEEAAQGALDLNARAVLPGHAGRFVLAKHTWNDPWQRLTRASQDKPYTLLTPVMGEVVYPAHTEPHASAWWETRAQ